MKTVIVTEQELDQIIKESYDTGMRDGITAHAVYHEGKQVVGCMATPLNTVLESIESIYNYNPRRE